MGRWGFRMFEGDSDLDMMGEIESDIQELSGVVVEFFDADQHELIRQTLDTGIGRRLFGKYSKNRMCGHHYFLYLFTMLCMKVGATIDCDNMQFLRRIIEFKDSGRDQGGPLQHLIEQGFFYEAGVTQFKAAVNYYRNGQPLKLGPYCSNCGNISSDIGQGLYRCGQCQITHYCSRRCQIADWRAGHKEDCENKEKNESMLGLFPSFF